MKERQQITRINAGIEDDIYVNAKKRNRLRENEQGLKNRKSKMHTLYQTRWQHIPER